MSLALPRNWFALAIGLAGTTAARADVQTTQVGGKLIVTADAAGGLLSIAGTFSIVFSVEPSFETFEAKG
ncbi:MAG: hypothetical protein IPH13_15235 [Planctomycetes bacterium]|nr:hypothetical protein [Planctomycetota bacterium]MCC7172125.1 hypothetical protein [Planctomycetota bacterium]